MTEIKKPTHGFTKQGDDDPEVPGYYCVSRFVNNNSELFRPSFAH
jgi:hypothetical protein